MSKMNVSHHYLDVDGIKWHWVEQGEGTPIVLLHGIPESRQCWNGGLFARV